MAMLKIGMILFFGLFVQPARTAVLDIPEDVPIEISPTEYKFIELHADKILTQFPKEQYLYAVFGSALSPLSAYFTVIGIPVINIPASGLRKALLIDFRTDDDRKALRDHLLKYLPPPEELKGRKLLLLDHAFTALTLFHGRAYMQSLLGDRYPVESLALVYEGYDRELSHMLDHKIVYQSKEQLMRFVTKRYEEFSPYTSADLSGDLGQLPNVSTNPRYGLLVMAMHKAHRRFGCERKLS